MGSSRDDADAGLRDAALVLAARQEVDPVLARLVAQPFDSESIEALTTWLVHTYPTARQAHLRLQVDGRRGPFSPRTEPGSPSPGPALSVVPSP